VRQRAAAVTDEVDPEDTLTITTPATEPTVAAVTPGVAPAEPKRVFTKQGRGRPWPADAELAAKVKPLWAELNKASSRTYRPPGGTKEYSRVECTQLQSDAMRGHFISNEHFSVIKMATTELRGGSGSLPSQRRREEISPKKTAYRPHRVFDSDLDRRTSGPVVSGCCCLVPHGTTHRMPRNVDPERLC
jgi:hypothetical protein